MGDWFQPLSWVTDPVVIARQIMAGLANGMLLFLVASGLSLILGLTRIINFAHGSLFMLGAYAAFTAVGSSASTWSSFALMLVVSALAVAAFGIAFELIILRRIYRSPQAFQLLVTFSLVLICGDGVRLIWGNSEHAVSELPPQLEGYIRPFGVTFPMYRLFLIVTGVAVCVGLWAVLYRTRWGILVRAATVDRDMLRALGVNVGRLFTAVFALGAGLAGLAGGLAAPIASIGPGLHAQVLTDAFVIVAIGGMGSFLGSFVGAFLIGQANAFGILVLPQMAIVLPFALMIVVLVLRPQGLFGEPE
jgi:branched-chain amino acid transport system permease protein